MSKLGQWKNIIVWILLVGFKETNMAELQSKHDYHEGEWLQGTEEL